MWKSLLTALFFNNTSVGREYSLVPETAHTGSPELIAKFSEVCEDLLTTIIQNYS